MTLNATGRTLATADGTWSIQAVHQRPGGDVDVVLGLTPDGRTKPNRYQGYRYDHAAARWSMLAGAWTDLDNAAHAAVYETATQVLTEVALIPLLNLALTPAPDPDAAYKATLEDGDLA